MYILISHICLMILKNISQKQSTELTIIKERRRKMAKNKLYAHLFGWDGNEDVVEIEQIDVNDIVLAVERQAFVRVGNRIIDGSLYRTVDILEADIETTDM